MRKIIPFGLLIGLSFVPIAVLGVTLDNPLNATSFEAVINSIINFVFYIGMALVPLGIVVSAFYFFTAAGDVQQVGNAKKILFYTLLGLAILLLSKALASILTAILHI